jgi:hypothetical protein
MIFWASDCCNYPLVGEPKPTIRADKILEIVCTFLGKQLGKDLLRVLLMTTKEQSLSRNQNRNQIKGRKFSRSD